VGRQESSAVVYYSKEIALMREKAFGDLVLTERGKKKSDLSGMIKLGYHFLLYEREHSDEFSDQRGCERKGVCCKGEGGGSHVRHVTQTRSK